MRLAPVADPRAQLHVLGAKASAPERKYRDPNTATTLAVLGTALPAALVVIGSDSPGLAVSGLAAFTLAPSLGHWYAGRYMTFGMGLRLAGAGITFLALSSIGDDAPPPQVFAPGLVLMGAGALLDIAMAGSAARDYNTRFRLAPTVLHDGRGPLPGLAAAASF
ncbi:MAG: hypothetical protein IPI49_00755 [Myxococcales bacterium]|nr:hypothetical protein [Myxococcales bacterium]